MPKSQFSDVQRGMIYRLISSATRLTAASRAGRPAEVDENIREMMIETIGEEN